MLNIFSGPVRSMSTSRFFRIDNTARGSSIVALTIIAHKQTVLNIFSGPVGSMSTAQLFRMDNRHPSHNKGFYHLSFDMAFLYLFFCMKIPLTISKSLFSSLNDITNSKEARPVLFIGRTFVLPVG